MNYPNILNQSTGSKNYRPKSSSGKQKSQPNKDYRSQTPKQTSGRSFNQTKANQNSFIKMRQVKKHFSGVKDPLTYELNRNHHSKTHKSSIIESEDLFQKRRPKSKGNIFGSPLKMLETSAQDIRPHSEHHEVTLTSSQAYNQSDSYINARSQVTQCFDQDTTVIDNLKINDPIILKLLGDLKIDSNMNPLDMENLLNQNTDYLLHMLSCCACFKCDCGLCRCNFVNGPRINNKQSRFLTTYNKNFILSDGDTQNPYCNPTLNQSHYETLSKIEKQNFQDTMLSIQKSSYVPQKLQRNERSKESVKSNLPFAASTTYQKNFIDWRSYDPSYQFKRPLHRSVHKDVKFCQSTIYNQDFNLKQIDLNLSASDIKQNQVQQEKQIQLNNSRPFIINYPSVNLSMYQDQFKKDQRDLNLKPRHKFQSELEKYDPQNSYNNQYLSISKQSYQQPKMKYCNEKTSKKNLKSKQQLQKRLFSRIREITMMQKAQQ